MKKISASQLLAIFSELEIQKGDSLLIHSALQFLGQPECDLPGLERPRITNATHLNTGVDVFYETICLAVQCEEKKAADDAPFNWGTIAVPTFNFAFTHGASFDPQTTPSQGMGALSEYVRKLPMARRTRHPMQSLAIVGRWADDLAERDTLSAFDPGSAFERMLALDFKLLLLGADIQAVSMVHYCEQRAQVPYRYWKEFSGPVQTFSGLQWRTYRMFVRDLSIDPKLDLTPIQAELEKQRLWKTVPVNYGKISTCRLTDFVEVTDKLLRQDPWSLVSKPSTTLSHRPISQNSQET
jgi:aminoglycoside 3-N-acetyltransferase